MKDPRHTQTIRELAEQYRKSAQRPIVETAYMTVEMCLAERLFYTKRAEALEWALEQLDD